MSVVNSGSGSLERQTKQGEQADGTDECFTECKSQEGEGLSVSLTAGSLALRGHWAHRRSSVKSCSTNFCDNARLRGERTGGLTEWTKGLSKDYNGT